MLMTIKAYCEERKVSRQYVHEYITKGRLKAVELPVFAEYGGQRIEVGRQKFVEPPPMPTSEMDDTQRANWLAAQATPDLGIRADLAKILLVKEDGKPLRAALDSYYADRPDAERVEYAAAKAKVRKLLFEEAAELLGSVKALTDEAHAEKG